MQLKLFYKHFLVSIPLPGPVHTCPLLFWAFSAVALFGRRGLSASGVHLQQEYNLRVSAFFFLALGFAFLCICYHIFVLSLSQLVCSCTLHPNVLYMAPYTCVRYYFFLFFATPETTLPSSMSAFPHPAVGTVTTCAPSLLISPTPASIA